MTFDLSALFSKLNMMSASDHSSIVPMNLFVVLLCGCIVPGRLLDENWWVNESITTLLIGLCTGVIILLISGGKSSHLLVFKEDLFFIFLLSPIIFNVGFQVKKKQFFLTCVTIMMFGALDILISFVIISVGNGHGVGLFSTLRTRSPTYMINKLGDERDIVDSSFCFLSRERFRFISREGRHLLVCCCPQPT